MQDDNNKRPEEIGHPLYVIRNKSAIDRQNEKLPDAFGLPPEEISYLIIKEPIIKDSVYLRLSIKNISKEEAFSISNEYFDSENAHLLEASKAGIDALTQNEIHLSRRQANLEKDIEETPSIRTLYSKENLIGPSILTKLSYAVSLFIIVALFIIEWGNLGSSAQMSGEEVFLGGGGFLKALLVTSVPVILTVLLKTWFSSINRKIQEELEKIIVAILSVLAMVYFFAFANYYGWSIDDTSLATPPDIYKKIMLYTQLAITSFSIALIVNKFGKQSNHYKKQAVFYNKEHLALDEEHSSIVARRRHVEKTIKHLEGFMTLYLAKKSKFAQEFYSEYVEFQVSYLAVTNTAIANLRDKDNKKPILRVVKGDKK